MAFERIKYRLDYGITDGQKAFLNICGGLNHAYIESLDKKKLLAVCSRLVDKNNGI